MSVNMKQSPLSKNGAGKTRSLSLGIALLLAVFMPGCGTTTKPTLSAIAPSIKTLVGSVATLKTVTEDAP